MALPINDQSILQSIAYNFPIATSVKLKYIDIIIGKDELILRNISEMSKLHITNLLN